MRDFRRSWITSISNVSSSNISTTSASPLSFISTKSEKIFADLQPIVESKRFQNSKDKKRYLRRHCSFWRDSIDEIAAKTADQFDDPCYVALRKYRLTASCFGEILKAIRLNSYPPSLFKKLLGEYRTHQVLQPRNSRYDWEISQNSDCIFSRIRLFAFNKIRVTD